ncbi:MAG TPA: hypothetical protein VK459_27385, partial [Polyangiaceae bacterium]|nr:hypothetical protein [Polyangiaceae bacterium]
APADVGASPLPEPGDEIDDPLAPFAVSLGRGAVFAGGFAVGALRDAEGGSVAHIATLGFDGKNGQIVRLARSRGDLEPPVLAGAGAAVLAVMLEPNAAGRAIKIAKLAEGAVTWGAELAEGRDESLAMDLAASGDRAVLVWDDVPKDGKRGVVMLASFDVATLRSTTRPRPASPPSVDADSPRIVARPGGYWLAYVAQAASEAGKTAGESKVKQQKVKKKPPTDEIDEERGGEAISHRWVELIPLDEAGAPAGTPRAVTPRDGHVLAYDVELGEDGSALLAFRDDDTPSGSSGGRVGLVAVKLGGAGEVRVVAEEGVGAGVPELLPGWLTVASLSGPLRLAPVTGAGELSGPLAPEASFGVGGEVLAATREALLVARPAGRAMKLSVTKCSAANPMVPAAPADADAGAEGGAP